MIISSAKAASIVDLEKATDYAVFSGTEIINAGIATKINGGIRTFSEVLIAGLTTDQSTSGVIHVNDDNAKLVQEDLIAAYDNIKKRDNAKSISSDLGGQTLSPGAYSLNLPATVAGTLKLDAQGDANAVFIFQADSTLATDKNSRIELVNGATFNRVFWQVSNNVMLGEKTIFCGNILADTSIFAEPNVTVQGRLLAITGGVTLNNTQVDTTEIVSVTDGYDSDMVQVEDSSEIVEATPEQSQTVVDNSQETNLTDAASTVQAINATNTETANTDLITLAEAADTYKVTIDWGAMSFNYDLGTWNPNDHSWVGGGWDPASFDGINNQIKVTNESTQPVTAALTYIPDSTGGGSIIGTFEDISESTINVMELPLCPTGGPAPINSAYLKLQGEPTQIGSIPTKIGSISIQLNSVSP